MLTTLLIGLTAVLFVIGVLATILMAVVPNLIADDVKLWLWKLALRIAQPTFDDDGTVPVELLEYKDAPLTALVVALQRRRDAGDPPLPPLLRRVIAVSRSSTEVARLWLPTAVGGLVLIVEIALLLLVATHVDHEAVQGLALALAIIIVIDAGPLALTTTVGAVPEAERNQVWTYTLLVGTGSCGLLAVFWSGLVGNPFGVVPATWDAAMQALQGLAVAPLFVAVRRHLHGSLIVKGRTAWIAVSTVVRTVSSLLMATLLSVVFDAGVIGIGVAMTIGVAIEATIVRVGEGGMTTTTSTELRRVLGVARTHVPLSIGTLLALAPESAVLVSLAVSDGTMEKFWAWLVLFIGPMVASATLDFEAVAASAREERITGMRGLSVVVSTLFTALWALVAYTTDLPGMPWLLAFPVLCVSREFLRGRLVASGRIVHTLLAVAVGSLTLLFVFAVTSLAGLQPISAAAIAISVGAFTEMAALWFSSRR